MSDDKIESAGELLAHAYQMELEAQERYELLAEQMKVHNNTDLAQLFAKLAVVEGIHAKDILEQMQGMDIPEIAPDDLKWHGQESPEALDLGDMDYLMTPRKALLLALKAEENAYEFFARLLRSTKDPEIKRFAAEFAEEEEEHVVMVEKELLKYPPSSERIQDDMDDAVDQG